MCSGEQSEFKVLPSLAFGSTGNEALKVPPDATILYTITLHSFENPPELWDMSTETHFSEAERFKTQGNDAFRTGQYQRAIKKYEHSLKIIKDDNNFNDDEKKNAKAIVATIASNLALTYYKQQEYGECLTKVNEILNDDPKNLKALVRRGQSHMMMGNNDLAKEDFKRALEIEPNNQVLFFKKDVKKLIAANKKRIQEHRDRERQLYGNMFASKPKKNKPQNVPSEKTTESKEKEEITTAESSEKN
ncbi:hypothetical protein RFI_25477 [Reticulomyxa filosa]|uniref:peptidylprolyl isomerase n=1 Tax=Reticulomyxa filosa TaxID=46433 RepID=X6MDG2_RETFI|nr:hypothetical protein RFI_25477 [Reticulomyxa filosa]|eukprot:ETO11899.1 hypothetical protein RFI_25477 [Reticulomyxa filosa]